MAIAAWITLGVLILVLILLVGTRLPTDAGLAGGVALLLIAGVIDAHDALYGFANEGVITIAVLFVVASGVKETGALNGIVPRLLGRGSNLVTAQARMMLPAAVLSAFVNNTPLVAMLLPVISDWGRSLKISASKLLLPLSVASILGGACTLIGTSTNLIVNGWLLDETDQGGMSMFEIGQIGLPVAVVGIAYVLLTARWLLPDRAPVLDTTEDPRQYTVELMVDSGSPLAGKTIEDAGLRGLPGLYLAEIDRGNQVLPAVSGNVKLRQGDRLVFVGAVGSVVDLQKIRGLSVADNQTFKLGGSRTNRVFLEAVVSDSCPIIGQTIKEGQFRTRYSAVVIAVARNGERLSGKLGDIRLRAGDTLLLEARANFAAQQGSSRDFFLVSRIEGAAPPNHERAGIALAAVVGMVILVTAGWLSMLKASLLAAGVMLIAGCCRVSGARAAVDLPVLVVIAASLGLGRAIQVSGLADVMAELMLSVAGGSPHAALAMVFTVTALLAGAITAKAAAVLVLPVALVLSGELGVAFMPFAIAVMMAASTTIATPIGYPTNMMVMGPGSYRYRDYLVFGTPLTLIIGAMCVGLIPVFWPFAG
ncbi:MAG: di/tricarboxylate transporter [Myxococcota bacterium]|jgi:di/tricarboxylate transporter